MMTLAELLTVLRAIAPEALAEDWDPVGVHLAGDGSPIRRAMLCIDLTPAVLDEAIGHHCQLIVAYHPPIFQPLKRLADRDWKERMLARAVRHGIAIYSPHTALDAVRPGMNDWLCDGLGETSARWTIAPPKRGLSANHKVVVFVPRDAADRVRRAMFEAGGGTIGRYFDCSFNLEGIGTFHGEAGTKPAIGVPGRLETVAETRVEIICAPDKLAAVLMAARQAHPYEEPAIDVFQLANEPLPEDQAHAPGRVAVLKRPISARTLIERLKQVLGVKQITAAIPDDGAVHDAPTGASVPTGEDGTRHKRIPKRIQSIAVCVGAGGSLFEKVPTADAYITGEMQHHQVLDLYLKGKLVLLAGHTQTERPFLRRYRERLSAAADRIDWLISAADRAPMRIM